MSITSTKTIRQFLIDQMHKVAEGEQDAADAKAICNYSQQVYNTINMELRFALAKKRLGDEKVAPVDFG